MKQVYILRSFSASGHLYVGVSGDCDRRLGEHNEGRCAHTRKFRPWKIVYWEDFEKDCDALARERQIKKWSRLKKEALIEGDKVTLKRIAKRGEG